jgi:hypothetical protein
MGYVCNLDSVQVLEIGVRWNDLLVSVTSSCYVAMNNF